MMELYLEGTEPTEEQLIAAIRRATIASKVTPVLTGSAFKNKGVQPMLDAIVRYLPSPLDVGAIEGHAVGDEDEIESRASPTRTRRSPRSPSRSPATRTWASSPTSASTPAR